MTLTSSIGRRFATASIAIITAASGVAVTAAGAQADPEVTPTITTLDPNTGPQAGGNTVTIIGTGFSGVTAVNFGNTGATGVGDSNDTDTRLVVTAPAGTGAVPVTVTTDGGTSDSGIYTYQAAAAPTITSINPNQGPAAGGTRVTIAGTGFSDNSTVQFGSVTATNPLYNATASTITVDSPADANPPTTGNTHPVQVTVTDGDQTSDGATFTYGVAPAVTALSPSSGPAAGGTQVTITGQGFTGATAVQFGGLNATSYTVVSNTSITAVAPADPFTPPNSFDVFVTTPYGKSTDNDNTEYSYAAAPTQTAPTLKPGPESVPFGGTVTLTGTATPGATVGIFFHVKGQQGYDQRRTLTADDAGAFSTTYVATRDQRYYAQVDNDGTTSQSDSSLTQTAPTVSGPLSRTVKRNGTAIISGRAGIDSDYVDIHFHKAGTPANDYSIVRRVPVNDDGQYSRAYTATVDYRFFVTSQNGRASDNYLYQAR